MVVVTMCCKRQEDYFFINNTKVNFFGCKHLAKKKILFNIKRTKTTIIIIFCWYMKIQYMEKPLGSPPDLVKPMRMYDKEDDYHAMF